MNETNNGRDSNYTVPHINIEIALKESEERYKRITSAITDYIYSVHIEDGKVLQTRHNPGCIAVTGYSDYELDNDSYLWFKMVSPEHREQVQNQFKMVFEGKNPPPLEHKIIRKDGAVRWVRNTHVPFYDANGQLVSYDGLIQDITDRKNTELALQTSEERFRSIFENSTAGVALVSLDSKYLMVNHAYSKILGYSSAELLNLSFFDITHPDDVTRSKNEMDNIKDGSTKSSYFLKKYIHKDGREIMAEVSSILINDSDGTPLYFITHLIDVTQRMHAEEQFRILYEATEQTIVSITITDKACKIAYVNPQFEKMTGYSSDEVLGKDLWLIKSTESTTEIHKEMCESVKSGKVWKGEFLNKKKNGKLFWDAISISPIRNSAGEITHFVFIEEDITEKRNLFKQLIIAKEKAEEMNRLKSNFLSNMSHELRTPLVGLLGFAEVLEEELEGTHKEFAAIINQSGKRLITTLNEILSYSEIEANKFDIVKLPISISNLVNEEICLFNSIAHKKKLFIKTDLCEDFTIQSDELFLRKILDNLLNNAIKFTTQGGITISLSHDDDWIHLIVSDTGIGIPKEKHEMIFEEFRQASEGRSRNFDGTGLGLTIVKKYVEFLGGRVSVESELGKGSSFIIKLPVSLISEEKPLPIISKIEGTSFSTTVKNDLMKYAVLLVEDEELNALAIQRMLSMNYNVTHVTNARDAISFVNTKVYDLILMDINLKHDMSGIEAVKVIRQINNYEKIPIVAMTAFALQRDKEEFLGNGCSHFIAKPFMKEAILELLENIFYSNKK